MMNTNWIWIFFGHDGIFTFIFFTFALFETRQCTLLDNAVIGDPTVDCMEDQVRLTFHTQHPFKGRIFVKGMIENDKCVNSYANNNKQAVDFHLINGQCNMRRSRKLAPDQHGVEQSITVIISFHDIFITKVDRAYRCTCFYMEADKVVTNRLEISMLPTTELADTARMPLCTYTVRRDSVDGPIVTYAIVGEPVFHVWSCDSNMFSMLVHNCFVDDGAGKDRKPLIDEHGCTIDSIIVNDLIYNDQANLAYSEVNVFKFADKITTYFQCAVSTCMISEGMCKGKTPPRCGANSRRRRTILGDMAVGNNNETGKTPNEYVMDLSAEKIVVLDLDDGAPKKTNGDENIVQSGQSITPNRFRGLDLDSRLREIHNNFYGLNSGGLIAQRVCFSYQAISFLTFLTAFSILTAILTIVVFCWRRRSFVKKL